MKLAISNIAWDVEEDEAVAMLLRRYGVTAVDVAPGKYFPNPTMATHADAQSIRVDWERRGIQVTGMQALLFGTTGLNVFGDTPTQTALLAHLKAVCRIAHDLGARRLVFGSPKNRDRSGLSDGNAEKEAVAFFRRVGDVALAEDVIICLEPNPTRYGANFMTTTAETARIVEAVQHCAIKMQLDTGALTINGESVTETVSRYAPIIGHIHLSEPDLVPLGDFATDHRSIAKTIRAYLPNHVACIEMLATPKEPHLQSIERALRVVVENYGD